MKRPDGKTYTRRPGHFLIPLFLCLTIASAIGVNDGSPSGQHYIQRSPSQDGTGRFYMGREIARVMGVAGAAWLERSSRQKEERPDLLLKALKLRPGDVVADIGAGTGYHTRQMARKVGPQGTVYAVDIQPEMLRLLGAARADAT